MHHDPARVCDGQVVEELVGELGVPAEQVTLGQAASLELRQRSVESRVGDHLVCHLPALALAEADELREVAM